MRNAWKRSTVGMLCTVAIGLFLAFGCEKSPIDGDSGKNDTIVEFDPSSLDGTKWKLEGIVDEQTNALKELAPKDCEECYTLTFDTDSTATVHSITNERKLNLSNLPLSKNPIPDVLYSEYYYKDSTYYADTDTFWRAVVSAYHYVVISKEIRLYHRDACGKINYLRFKKIES